MRSPKRTRLLEDQGGVRDADEGIEERWDEVEVEVDVVVLLARLKLEDSIVSFLLLVNHLFRYLVYEEAHAGRQGSRLDLISWVDIVQ